jgi:hypothetical protein
MFAAPAPVGKKTRGMAAAAIVKRTWRVEFMVVVGLMGFVGALRY